MSCRILPYLTLTYRTLFPCFLHHTNHFLDREVFDLLVIKKRWHLGRSPRPRWGSLERSPRPPSWVGRVPPFTPFPSFINYYSLTTPPPPPFYEILDPPLRGWYVKTAWLAAYMYNTMLLASYIFRAPRYIPIYTRIAKSHK